MQKQVSQHSQPDSSKSFVPASSHEEDGWETMSETSEAASTVAEWEEQFILLEINDMTHIQNLFEKQAAPISQKNKKHKFKSPPKKPTHPKINIEFLNLNSRNPVLQMGNSHYSCRWEEPPGSPLIFKKQLKPPTFTNALKQAEQLRKAEKLIFTPPSANSDAPTTTPSIEKEKPINSPTKSPPHQKGPSSRRRAGQQLKSIIPEPIIPEDPIFHNISSKDAKDSYEVVAVIDRILKAEKAEVTKSYCKLPKHNRKFYGGLSGFRVPVGYTMKDLLGGRYIPRRRRKKKAGEKLEKLPRSKPKPKPKPGDPPPVPIYERESYRSLYREGKKAMRLQQQAFKKQQAKLAKAAGLNPKVSKKKTSKELMPPPPPPPPSNAPPEIEIIDVLTELRRKMEQPIPKKAKKNVPKPSKS